MACDGNSRPTLINCTITGNWGGLAGSVDGHTLTMINCSIVGNGGGEGGGAVYCGSSSILTNCILWGNLGWNLWVRGGENSSLNISFSNVEGPEPWPGEGNLNCDPLFIQPGHWDDNGTHNDTGDDTWIEGDFHLQPGSPCIDVGTSEGAPTTDIEGNGRPYGDGVDMGAYEMGGCLPLPELFIRGDSNSDGKVNVADPIYTLLYAFAGGEAPTCLDTADSNDDAAIDVADAIFVLQYLFVEGPMLPGPYPACGIDPTVDELGCLTYEHCE